MITVCSEEAIFVVFGSFRRESRTSANTATIVNYCYKAFHLKCLATPLSPELPIRHHSHSHRTCFSRHIEVTKPSYGKMRVRENLYSDLFYTVSASRNFITALTHFSPVSHFYTPWKRQKTFGFLTFSGGIEMWHWTKMG